MMTTLLILASAVAAPVIKDPPKKDVSIVGEWIGEKAVMGGKEKPVPEGGITFTFTAEGKMIITSGAKGREDGVHFKTETKKDPAHIDVTREGVLGNGTGIFKIEGDKLTLCINDDENSKERPTKFESPEGSRIMLTLQRKSIIM